MSWSQTHWISHNLLLFLWLLFGFHGAASESWRHSRWQCLRLRLHNHVLTEVLTLNDWFGVWGHTVFNLIEGISWLILALLRKWIGRDYCKILNRRVLGCMVLCSACWTCEEHCFLCSLATRKLIYAVFAEGMAAAENKWDLFPCFLVMLEAHRTFLRSTCHLLLHLLIVFKFEFRLWWTSRTLHKIFELWIQPWLNLDIFFEKFMKFKTDKVRKKDRLSGK